MPTKTILCLDPASVTGWALLVTSAAGFTMISGSWDFRPSRFDGAGMRYVRFRAQLLEIFKAHSVDGVFFEEVRRHIGADAARVYGALFGVITSLCEEQKIPYEGIPVGTIKKFWTGKGNSGKDLMVNAAIAHGYAPKDDNEADALALAHFVHDRDLKGNEDPADREPCLPKRSAVLS